MLSGLSSSSDLSVDQLLEKFSSGSLRQKRSLIPAVEKAADQLAAMGASALASFDREGDDWAAGWILQILNRHQPAALSPLLDASGGWFSTGSESDLDYSTLQQALLEERFEEADRLTSAFLRQLAGEQAERRGYVYFSEVLSIRGLDLVTIDRLWIAYSQGRFGFTVQARLLATVNGRYDKLWPRIGWKKEGVWTRYPRAFDWSLKAPEGHMPLINQLRGVRLIDALLNHPSLVARQ
jgi:hypothetical protein